MEPKIEELFNHPKSAIRSEVIDNAVKIEFLINQLLTRTFACDNNESTSFGTSGAALSFMSKVNLLIDIKILKKEEKRKLVTFAEIRNQFAHNFMVMTADNLSIETKKQLEKYYKNGSDNTHNYDKLNRLLYCDVKDIIYSLTNVLLEKVNQKVDDISNLQYNQILFKEIESYCKSDKDFENKLAGLLEKATGIFKNTPLTDDEIDRITLI